MSHLYYLRNMKQYCNYYQVCATLYSLVQYEENFTSKDSNATYRKSPLVVTTAVIPSQKCCLLGQVTLIHLHLSSMTEFSELGNGSQKVLCCDVMTDFWQGIECC